MVLEQDNFTSDYQTCTGGMKETFGNSGGEGGAITSWWGSNLKFPPWRGYGYFLELHIPNHVQLILQPHARLQSWTKLLRHFTKFPLIQGTLTPPSPISMLSMLLCGQNKVG